MKEIKTNGIEVLFAEVPEDVKSWDIEVFTIRDDSYIRTWSKSGHDSLIDLPQGQYQILGKSTELSEEQMKEICEECDRSKMNLRPYQSTPYKNYLSDGSSSFSGDDTWFKWNVQESYLSLLEANGIVDRCNIQKPEFNYEFGEDGPTDSQLLSAEIHFEESFRQWQESQSKVKHYLVLKKL